MQQLSLNSSGYGSSTSHTTDAIVLSGLSAMPRIRSRVRRYSRPQKLTAADHIEAFAALLIADAGDNDYDEVLALALLDLALVFRRHAGRYNGGRPGHPGPYVQQRCEQFFNWLLDTAPARTFRAYFRYVFVPLAVLQF